jgi:ATP-binding cassette subfamily C protein LapB
MMNLAIDGNVNASATAQQKEAAQNLYEFLESITPVKLRDTESVIWQEALSMLILSVNPRIKAYKVSEAMPYNVTEFDLVDLLDVMANLGYYARGQRLNISEVDERLLPALYIPDNSHDNPCVMLDLNRLYSSTERKLIPHDQYPRGKFWFFEYYQEEKVETSKNIRSATGYNWFRALTVRFKHTIYSILLSGFMLNIIALAAPLFIMLVYDRVISTGADNILPMLAIGAFAGVMMEWWLRIIRSKNLSWLSGRIGNIVSNRIFDQLLHLSPSYIERASVPSQVARIKTFEAIRDFFSGGVFLSMLELPFVIISLVVIAAIAKTLVFVPIFVSFLYIALFMVIWRHVKVAMRTTAKASSARQQFLIEAVNKIEAIRSSDLVGPWRAKFKVLSAREAVTSFRLSWMGQLGETFANGLTVLSAVAIIGFGIGMVWSGSITTGALVASMILVWRVLSPFHSLCSMIPRLDQLRNSIKQVDNLMEIDTEQIEFSHAARLSHIKGRISFVNVGIRYSMDSEPILAGLSFEALPGDIVAVTGSNGTGKTTLLKMIKGMYTPQIGSIRLDGFDIRQLDPVDLRRRIAYIPQTTHFYYGTIAENLRFANPLVTDDQLFEVLAQAGLTEDLARLPMGLDTYIGHGGMSLSSSLELRLAMVRAYIHEAPILLIDELPNSLLNDHAGAFMRDYLLKNKKDRTTILVTHREDFMAMADTIVVLRRNMPPMSGPRQFMLNEIRKQQVLS